MKTVAILIILTHFFSDWILQLRAEAENKTSSWKWMGLHLLTITVCFGGLNLYLQLPWIYVLINTVAHGIIDKFVWSGFKAFRVPMLDPNHVDLSYEDIQDRYLKGRKQIDPSNPDHIKQLDEQLLEDYRSVFSDETMEQMYAKEYRYRNLHAKDYWFYFTIGVDQILHLTIAILLFM